MSNEGPVIFVYFLVVKSYQCFTDTFREIKMLQIFLRKSWTVSFTIDMSLWESVIRFDILLMGDLLIVRHVGNVSLCWQAWKISSMFYPTKIGVPQKNKILRSVVFSPTESIFLTCYLSMCYPPYLCLRKVKMSRDRVKTKLDKSGEVKAFSQVAMSNNHAVIDYCR
jgi:hypothetical protein